MGCFWSEEALAGKRVRKNVIRPLSDGIIETPIGYSQNQKELFHVRSSGRRPGYVDVVIPRLSPSGAGWEVILIQRNKQLYQGMRALPAGHLNIGDSSKVNLEQHGA